MNARLQLEPHSSAPFPPPDVPASGRGMSRGGLDGFNPANAIHTAR